MSWRTELFAQADKQTSRVPETADSYLAFSLQCYREGRYADSIAACRAALALRPAYAEAWNNIGAAYNKLGQFEEGAKLVRNPFALTRVSAGAKQFTGTRARCSRDKPWQSPPLDQDGASGSGILSQLVHLELDRV